MGLAQRAITRLQDADDVTFGTPTDGYALVWDTISQKFKQASTLRGVALNVTGTITFPNTTATAGILYKGSYPFLHAYGDPAADGSNLFLGVNAGNFTSSPLGGSSSLGSQNIGIGEHALLSLTSGYRNTAIGVATMVANTTGHHNIAIGVSAMPTNTTGVYNIGIGSDTLHLNTTAGYNIAIGQNALFSLNKTDSAQTFNLAVGHDSLYATTTGYNNTAIGAVSLRSNTTGFDNIAIGYASLYDNTTHIFNTAIGFTAGRHADGNYGTYIGAQAGYTVVSGGGVYIGNQAGYYETGANKLFIDNTQRSSEADGRIKALIYGVFAATVAGQSLTFNAGKMGFFGHVAATQPSAYTPSNVSADRSFDADTVAVGELADVVGTLIADLQSIGLLQ